MNNNFHQIFLIFSGEGEDNPEGEGGVEGEEAENTEEPENEEVIKDDSEKQVTFEEGVAVKDFFL